VPLLAGRLRAKLTTSRQGQAVRDRASLGGGQSHIFGARGLAVESSHTEKWDSPRPAHCLFVGSQLHWAAHHEYSRLLSSGTSGGLCRACVVITLGRDDFVSRSETTTLSRDHPSRNKMTSASSTELADVEPYRTALHWIGRPPLRDVPAALRDLPQLLERAVQKAGQFAATLRVLQLAHRLGLDLPDPFAGDREDLADLFQRVGVAVGQPVA